MNKVQKERNITLDILKIVMAIFVVMIHCGTFSDISDSLAYFTCNGICRIGVPFFFIINGYYFTSITNLKSLLKWLKRAFMLYLFWMVFYAVMKCRSLNIDDYIFFVETEAFWGWWQLWYVVAMIQACILVYIFRNNIKAGSALAILLFVVGVIIQYTQNFHFIDSVFINRLIEQHTWHLHYNGLFFGYPLCYMGYMLNKSNYNLSVSLNKHLCYVAIAMCLLLLEIFFNYQAGAGGVETYVSLILVTPLIFLLAQRYNTHKFLNLPISNTNKSIGLVATAIYFIHPFSIYILSFAKNQLSITLNSISFTVIVTLLCFVFSFFLIKLNSKLKFIL